MCLSILRSFTSQILTELKNVDNVNQLQKTNASKRVKKACNSHFLVASVRDAALSFLGSFNSTSCSAVTV